MDDTTRRMKEVRDEVWKLENSPLYEERVKNAAYPVLGEGSHDARIVFVGEAPGKNEAEQGRPFCGRAGAVLDELLSSVGIERSEVYVTNIVKDRPPENRDPTLEEIAVYAPFLDRQIEAIKPAVIAALGRHSMKYLLERYTDLSVIPTISEAHGKEFRGAVGDEFVTIVPLFHPAVAVYDPSKKDELKKDFLILKKHDAATSS